MAGSDSESAKVGPEVTPLSPEQQWSESEGSSVLRNSALEVESRQLEEPWPWSYLPTQFPVSLY